MNEGHARCFGAISSRLRTRDVPLARLTDLLPLTHDQAAVLRYRERMADGDLFPPISVLPLFGRLIIADGHKRYQAALPLIAEPVPVEVWTFRHLLMDQWRQARANARKNGRIVAALFRDPPESVRLARSTVQHWIRVARCLRLLFAARPRPR